MKQVSFAFGFQFSKFDFIKKYKSFGKTSLLVVCKTLLYSFLIVKMALSTNDNKSHVHLGEPKFSGPPASLTILSRMVRTTSAVTVSAGYLENPECQEPFEVG